MVKRKASGKQRTMAVKKDKKQNKDNVESETVSETTSEPDQSTRDGLKVCSLVRYYNTNYVTDMVPAHEDNKFYCLFTNKEVRLINLQTQQMSERTRGGLSFFQSTEEKEAEKLANPLLVDGVEHIRKVGNNLLILLTSGKLQTWDIQTSLPSVIATRDVTPWQARQFIRGVHIYKDFLYMIINAEENGIERIQFRNFKSDADYLPIKIYSMEYHSGYIIQKETEGKYLVFYECIGYINIMDLETGSTHKDLKDDDDNDASDNGLVIAITSTDVVFSHNKKGYVLIDLASGRIRKECKNYKLFNDANSIWFTPNHVWIPSVGLVVYDETDFYVFHPETDTFVKIRPPINKNELIVGIHALNSNCVWCNVETNSRKFVTVFQLEFQ